MPYQDMWPDDIFLLLEVIKGNLTKGIFKFREKNLVVEQKIELVDRL
ncbi:MAG TPA: hypothetical protein PKA79_00950 [Oligoflexia bacterium]|nr:hypothetical protein [Oligoflexia bacterium]